jgi:hypothetical protein
MIVKIIEKLAKSIGYNSIYKTYYELSHSVDSNFVEKFKDTQNYYLKFAIFTNPNISEKTKREILRNDFDDIKFSNKVDYNNNLIDVFKSLIKFQSFYLDYAPKYLFEGEFAELHTKFASIDPHIEYDINKTRFRTFNLWQISKEILRNFQYKGDLFFAGINYGTAPLILSHIHKKNRDLNFHFIDPFDGTKNQIVNLDPKDFEKNLPAINYDLIVGVIPRDIPEFKKLIFIHLNTTNFDAELSSIDQLIQKLEIGGAIVWDIYGWLEDNEKTLADQSLGKHSLFKLILPTRQLLIIKQKGSAPEGI